MRPYGLKRNWNATEDYSRNGRAYRPSTHRKELKLLHRAARRIAKYLLRLGKLED